MTVYICCDIYTVKLYLRRQVEFKFGGKTLIVEAEQLEEVIDGA